MALLRKVRNLGASRVVTIPAQLADMLEIEVGDDVVWDHLGDGTLRLRKVVPS